MGEVYRAEDTTLDRKVALKFLTEELQQDPTARKRFLREAKSAAALDHPYICHIHEVGDVEGKSFISMEYVQGMTLSQKLSEEPLPLKIALETSVEIAEALEAAHKENIVHRDLKPSNIMLTPEGHVKVMDFGLAKRITPVEGQDEDEITTKLTKDDSILGTVPYMSPEQLRGREVDARSDIFSFGVVLYEMLAGVHPFKKSGQIETANAILSELVPPLSQYTENIPILLQHTVKKMLAKEPDRRSQLIHDVGTDLGDLIEESGDSQATPAPSPKRHANWVRAAGAIALIVLAAIARSFVTLRTLPDPPAVITRLSIGPVQGPIGRPSGTVDVAVSADGTHIAYASGGQIWLKPMDQAYAVPIVTGDSPFFSPDGEWLAFAGDGRLNTISINGGAPVEIALLSGTGAGGRYAGGTWSADGTIAFATSLGLFLVSEDGSDPQPLIGPPDGQVYAWPQFMPDGESLLFTVLAGPSPDTAEIALLDLQTMTSRIVHQGGVGARYVSEGYLVYVTGQGLAAIGFDPDTGRVRGASRQVPGIELQPDGAYLAVDFAISETGTLAHIPSSPSVQNWLVWVDRTGTEAILSGARPGRISYPRVSPQGDRVAFTLRSERGTSRRIWVLNLERGVATQVSGGLSVEGVFEDLLPQWSADGERLYLASNRTGPFQVYSVAADGSGVEELLIDHPDVNMPYRVNPDNRLFFFSGSVGRNTDAGFVNLADPSEPEWLLNSPYHELNAALSPDGTWIVYQSNESGDQEEIYLRPFPNVDASRERVSDGGDFTPCGTPGAGANFTTATRPET